MKPLWMNLSLIAALSGCTWIGDADYKAELVNVDEDGDGQTINEGDCNDQMPNVFLGNVETWYDGIDGDCGGDNDFDKDGDGFVPTEHQGKMTTSHVAVAPLPGGDCNDEDLESIAIHSGLLTGEVCYPLPYIPENWKLEFSSSVADMRNSVARRNNAQSACAGQFIGNHLSQQTPWLHIDIASAAFDQGRGTAVGIQLLLQTSVLYCKNSN